MVKLVAFDLDGTIGDTIPMCLKAFKMAVEPHIGYKLSDEDVFQTFGLDEEGMIKHFVDNTNLEAVINDFYFIYQKMHFLCPQPFAGMPELIKELRDKSVPVVLITGKGKKSCEITLQQFELDGYFDRLETGSSLRNRKCEAMRSLLADYNLKPDEMVYIGDTVSDISCCRFVGVRCLSAAWAKSADLTELEKYNKEYTFQSICSLKEYLLALLDDAY